MGLFATVHLPAARGPPLGGQADLSLLDEPRQRGHAQAVYKNNKRISAGGGKAGGGGSPFWIEERWGLDDNDEEGGGGEGKHQRK